MSNNIKLFPTQKIERLTVIKCLNKNDTRNRAMWLFKCECGNEIEAAASDINLGRKKSCGCLFKELRDGWGKYLTLRNLKPNNQGPANKLFGTYKRAAIRRNYIWELDMEQFRTIISKNCFYCGSVPKTEITLSKNKNYGNTLVYNGIDRRDNTIGYTNENCVPACFICNKMKMDMEYNDFISQITKIYKLNENH